MNQPRRERKMSHQPFESWLLSNEPLAPGQDQALQVHLKSCKTCLQLSIDWAEVKQLFISASPLKPSKGFTARWQARLAFDNLKEKRRRQIRQSVLVFLINAVGAMTLFFYFTFRLYQTIETPVEVLLVGIDRLTSILHFIKAIQEILAAILLVLTSVIPPEGWVILSTAAGLLSLVWIVSLHRLMIQRRITS